MKTISILVALLFWSRYDAAGNRTGATEDGVTLTAVPNAANQIVENKAANGKMLFRGAVSEPAAITLAGASATFTGLNWQVAAPVGAGANHLTLQATETTNVPAGLNAQTTVRHLDFTLNADKGFDYSYDLDGNQSARAGRQTFEWDAASRLTAINYTGTNKRSEFSYDGKGRRVKIVEKTGTTVTSDRRYLWDGLAIAEERDASNAVTRRFFAEGEQVLSASAITWEACSRSGTRPAPCAPASTMTPMGTATSSPATWRPPSATPATGSMRPVDCRWRRTEPMTRSWVDG